MPCCKLPSGLYFAERWPDGTLPWAALYLAWAWTVPSSKLTYTLLWAVLSVPCRELTCTLPFARLYLVVICTEPFRDLVWTWADLNPDTSFTVPCRELYWSLPWVYLNLTVNSFWTSQWSDLYFAVSWNISCRGPFCIMPWLIPNYQAMRRTLP